MCFVGIVTAVGVTAGLAVWMFGLFKGQFKLLWLLAHTYVNSYFSVWILGAIVDISVEIRSARHLQFLLAVVRGLPVMQFII